MPARVVLNNKEMGGKQILKHACPSQVCAELFLTVFLNSHMTKTSGNSKKVSLQ